MQMTNFLMILNAAKPLFMFHPLSL